MSSEASEHLVKRNTDKQASNEAESQANDKCANTLIYIQLALVTVFLALVATFFTFYGQAKSNAVDGSACTFYSYNDTTLTPPKVVGVSTLTSNFDGKNSSDIKGSANVTKDFSNLFLSSGFVYLFDILCRGVIIYGLFRRSIWFQIGGVVGTILVSTFGTTALLVLIPVYRYNAAGSGCCGYAYNVTEGI